MRTRFGPFMLVTETRQLLREGEEVHLSPKAFELLSVLVEQRPRVVTKQDLFQRIWRGTYVSEANLNVLVGELRRALADEARAPRFIRTAHGVGFAFCGESSDVDGGVTSRPPQTARFWLEAKDRAYPMEPGEHTIGRDPGCSIWLNDTSVSRRHARIRLTDDPGAAVLEDLGSTNGTFVERRRIDAPTALANGSRIRVGSVELTFREGGERLDPTRRVRRGAR